MKNHPRLRHQFSLNNKDVECGEKMLPNGVERHSVHDLSTSAAKTGSLLIEDKEEPVGPDDTVEERNAGCCRRFKNNTFCLMIRFVYLFIFVCNLC